MKSKGGEITETMADTLNKQRMRHPIPGQVMARNEPKMMVGKERVPRPQQPMVKKGKRG